MRHGLLFIVLGAVGLAGCQQHPANHTQAKEAALPAKATSRLPEFSARDLQGNTISSVDLRGKVVLIDFWATWCQPCKQEMPGYQRLADVYGPRGFVVVGFKLATMKDTEDPIRFAKKLGVHYPLVVATDETIQNFGGIEGLPTTLLYDRQGVLHKKVIGFEYTQTFETDLKPLL
jgi:thiol-disulfide isomerase/thioredoxin